MKTLIVLVALVWLVATAPLDDDTPQEGADNQIAADATRTGDEAADDSAAAEGAKAAEDTEDDTGQETNSADDDSANPAAENAEATKLSDGEEDSEAKAADNSVEDEEGGGAQKTSDDESAGSLGEGESFELREILIELINEIPIAEMKKFAVQHLSESFAFREAASYMKSDSFVEMIHDLEKEPEVVELKAFFKDAGLDLDEYSEMICSFFRHLDFNGEQFDENKAYLGSFLKGIKELIPREKFMYTFEQQKQKSEVFRKFMETITSERAHKLVVAVTDLEQFQTVKEKIKEMGIDIEPIFDKLFVSAGWSRGSGSPSLEDEEFDESEQQENDSEDTVEEQADHQDEEEAPEEAADETPEEGQEEAPEGAADETPEEGQEETPEDLQKGVPSDEEGEGVTEPSGEAGDVTEAAAEGGDTTIQESGEAGATEASAGEEAGADATTAAGEAAGEATGEAEAAPEGEAGATTAAGEAPAEATPAAEGDAAPEATEAPA